MCLDAIAMDELGPILSFLDQGACKNALLPQLDDGLEDTEATVQDDHIPLVEYGGKHPKQQSNCGTPCCQILAAQELWDDPCPPQDLSPTLDERHEEKETLNNL